MHVLICGGEVIGASLAYFLSRRGVKAMVIESTGLACAASGKSGGFLARDWCDGSPLARLARRSFALHSELAERIAEDWGYRRLDTYGGFSGFPDPGSAYELGWLSPGVSVSQRLGSPENTAQVHPGRFTAAMMRAAQAQGAKLRLGRVTGIRQHAGRVTGVDIVFVTAERLVQDLEPRIADPAIGGDADPAAVFRVQQILVRCRLACLFGIVDKPHHDQHERREPVFQRPARRLLGTLDDVLVVGADIEVVILQTAAECQEVGFRLQHGQGGEGRVAAGRHRFGGEYRVDRELLGHLDAGLLLESGRVDK
jgi:glycine/D-amino acid oxidase-like deaminating enzyme